MIEIAGISLKLADIFLSSVSIILGLFASYYFYRISRPIKRIYYTSKDTDALHVYQQPPEGITIHYKGRCIRSFTRSLITFWNSGNETIDRNDRIDADPFQINIDPNVVLEIKIVDVRKRGNNFSIRYGSNSILVEFDFMDPGDGALLDLRHQAGFTHADSKSRLMTGSFRRMNKKIGRVDSPLPIYYDKSGYATVMAMAVFVGQIVEIFNPGTLDIRFNIWIFIGFGAYVAFLFGVNRWFKTGRKPKELRRAEKALRFIPRSED